MKRSSGPHLLRGLRWALLALVALLLAYQAWLFGWVLWWNWNDPGLTRFMEIRLDGLREKNPKAQLVQQWVPYDRVSIHLKRALVAAEDDLFVRHDGFDWDGIQKAMEKNRQRGHIVAGGSTITQQLAKNLLLTPDKTPWRKAQEAAVTVMLEATWSKRRILEVYINVIEWGNGVFGAEAAARHYFGIGAGQLSAEQAALLASMVPSPRYYERHRDSPALARHSAALLARMNAAQVP